MQEAVVIPQDARRALAAYLLDQKYERPQTIHPQIWRGLLHAEIALLDYPLLGELVDVLSPQVLDVIRWPEEA